MCCPCPCQQRLKKRCNRLLTVWFNRTVLRPRSPRKYIAVAGINGFCGCCWVLVFMVSVFEFPIEVFVRPDGQQNPKIFGPLVGQ